MLDLINCLPGLLGDLLKTYDILPHQAGWQALSCQLAIDRIVTETFRMFCKVCQRVVDLSTQQTHGGSNPDESPSPSLSVPQHYYAIHLHGLCVSLVDYTSVFGNPHPIGAGIW